MVGTPPIAGRTDIDGYPALLGKFERVRQQILEHLLQAPLVGIHALRERRIDVDTEVETFVVRDLPESSFHVL